MFVFWTLSNISDGVFTVNYFWKKLYLSCLTGLWIRLCLLGLSFSISKHFQIEVGKVKHFTESTVRSEWWEGSEGSCTFKVFHAAKDISCRNDKKKANSEQEKYVCVCVCAFCDFVQSFQQRYHVKPLVFWLLHIWKFDT